MKDLLDFIIKSIVENPQDVEITENEEEGITLLKIKVNQEDLKVVIGKEGKTIRAIREVMKIPATKQNKRVRVDLVEV